MDAATATTGTAHARPNSTRLSGHASDVTPGGVHSNVRLAGPSVFFDHGMGAWLYDVDGRDYVDYVLGQGPNFLGNAPKRVNEAVARAAERGGVFGGQHALEIEASELFLHTLGWADRVRFALTGTEANQAALRLARAATDRSKFIRFAGTYHGWLDNVLMRTADGVSGPASQGQLVHHLDDTYVLPFNDVDALAATLDAHDDIAAVLVEPMMCNAGAITPRDGYLQRMRELCDWHGVVLIFDEVITGFRLAPGGAAQRFGVTPDLGVYGKAMAGGWPVSALAGRASLMDMLADGVNHSGTFNSSLPACAAVTATLTELREDPPYHRVEAYGKALISAIRELGAAHGLPIRVQGLPMAFHVSFGDPGPIHHYAALTGLDTAGYADFAVILADHGVWATPRGIWYVSAAHGDNELAETRERLDAAMSTISGRSA